MMAMLETLELPGTAELTMRPQTALPGRAGRAYRLQDRDLLFTESPSQYVLRLRDLPDAERPRERLAQLGPAALSVAELVAILWGVGSLRRLFRHPSNHPRRTLRNTYR